MKLCNEYIKRKKKCLQIINFVAAFPPTGAELNAYTNTIIRLMLDTEFKLPTKFVASS